MTKKLVFFSLVAAILIPTITIAQTPNCGLSGSQAPIIPGTQSGGSQDWSTFSAPALGSSYTDGLGSAPGGKGGCQITRISQLGSASVGTVYDSEVGAFSQDDKMVWLNRYTGGGQMIVSTPADSAHTPGTPVLSFSQMPGHNGNIIIWSYTQANQFYYTNGSSIMLATINGLPGCIANASCTTSSSTVVSYTSGGSTGSGYKNVIFPDKYDAFPGALAFIGFNSSGTMDLDVYSLSAGTTDVWHTTSCTASLASQPGCVHGILQFPDGTVMAGYGSADGSLSGNVWFHGTPGAATATQLQVQTCHNAVGTDANGVEKWVVCRLDDLGTSSAKEACPSGQFSGQLSGGGQDMVLPTDPYNENGEGLCSLNTNWESQEFSWHGSGGASQPFYLTSFWDSNRTGSSAEYFSNSGNYDAGMVTCTQTNLTTSGGCWVAYQDELVLVNSTSNFNSVCASASCFSGVFRLGWARSRSNENFWSIPNASISRDGNYIAFSSNMAYPNGVSGNCTSTENANGGCAEAYILSGPNGSPLLGAVSSSPNPPSSGAPNPPSGLTAKVQ